MASIGQRYAPSNCPKCKMQRNAEKYREMQKNSEKCRKLLTWKKNPTFSRILLLLMSLSTITVIEKGKECDKNQYDCLITNQNLWQLLPVPATSWYAGSLRSPKAVEYVLDSFLHFFWKFIILFSNSPGWKLNVPKHLVGWPAQSGWGCSWGWWGHLKALGWGCRRLGWGCSGLGWGCRDLGLGCRRPG